MRRIAQPILFAALLVAMGASRARGQNDQQQNGQQQTGQPQATQPDQPVGGQQQNGEADNGDANVIPAVVQPDLQATNGAGAFLPTFELPPDHSYILPSFQFMSTVNTNGAYSSTPGQSQLVTLQYLLGGITIEKVGRANELSVDYLGGRSFSADGGLYNSTTQLFTFHDKWMKNRWTGTLSDQLSYASDTYFGGGVGSPGLGIQGLNVQPGFNSTQSLVVGRIPILNNGAVAELDYQASQRGSFTFVGSYSILHYYGSGLINNNSALAEIGYNYELSPQSAVAVEYLFDAIRFGGNVESINENVLQVTYSRNLAKRLNFRIGAGPDVSLIQGTGIPSTTNASWRLTASLIYQLHRASLSFAYSHMLTGGSGVFLGSETDTVTTTLARPLTRYLSASLNFGYSRNSELGVNSGTTPALSYDSIYGGAGITRQIGRDWKFTVNYVGTYQTGQGTCATPPCGANFSNQQVVAGIAWHPRAFAIE